MISSIEVRERWKAFAKRWPRCGPLNNRRRLSATASSSRRRAFGLDIVRVRPTIIALPNALERVGVVGKFSNPHDLGTANAEPAMRLDSNAKAIRADCELLVYLGKLHSHLLAPTASQAVVYKHTVPHTKSVSTGLF
jgi:hypothetical protein